MPPLDHPVAASAPKVDPPMSHRDGDNNPTGISFLELLREDYRTHGGRFRELGMWPILVHRFGNWRMRIRPRWVRLPFSMLYNTLYTTVEIATGVSLPYNVPVGRRVRIWHQSGIILHARSIGDDTQIRQNTTMGIARADRLDDLPTIGARVDIGCGACILGNVHVGDDSRVGANAVVLCDVPAGATAVGVPARIVRWSTKGES